MPARDMNFQAVERALHQLKHRASPGQKFYSAVRSGQAAANGMILWSVGFQNSALRLELVFYAARSYSLMKPVGAGNFVTHT
ncbi:MAG: hypothetical protein ABR926_26605 [Streptosporangiaceae bacterium]|jgi:hypothetical protein